jgi:hypothetical protein
MGFKIPNFAKQMGGSPFHVSYDAAYDALSDEKKAEYRKSDKAGEGKGRARFTEKAKAYNREKYGTTEPTKAAESGKLSDAQTKKLIVEKLKAKKKREDVAKAKKNKPAETKSDKPKTKTRKQMRAEKRVGRLKKKQEKKGALTPGQQKRLDRNKSKAKGEKVQEKDKTNVGKAIKKGVDKVKDVVKTEKDSPAKYKNDAQRKAAHASMAEKK